MARKTAKRIQGEQFGTQKTKQDPATDVRMHMEVLRRELHQLAQRAETELEKNLRELPAPILSMVVRVATLWVCGSMPSSPSSFALKNSRL